MNRCRLAVVALITSIILVGGAAAAWAFFSGTGTGNQLASSPSLAAPGTGTATGASTTTMSVSWGASSNLPAGGTPHGYEVLRSPGTTFSGTSTSVSSFTGTQTFSLASASGFSASGGVILVATTTPTGTATLSYSSITTNTLQNVKALSGSGTISNLAQVIQGSATTAVAAASNGNIVSNYTSSSKLYVTSTSGFPTSGTVEVVTSTGLVAISFSTVGSDTNGPYFQVSATPSGSGTLSTGGSVTGGAAVTGTSGCAGLITTISCTDSGLVSGTTYYYAVQTLFDNWVSSPNTPFPGTTPTAVTNVTFSGSPQTTATWTVGFTTSLTGALVAGNTITATFNSSFGLPASGAAVTLPSGFSNCTATEATSGQTATITLVGASCVLANSTAGTFTIAGITDPAAGSYANTTFSVATSKDTSAVNPSSNVVIISTSLNAVNVVDSTHTWAVGANCSILFDTGLAWTQDTNVPAACVTGGVNLTGVSVTSTTEGIVVGSSGTVLVCSASCESATATWSALTQGTGGTIPASTTKFTAVWATGSASVLAVGNDSSAGGVIWACSATCNSSTAGTGHATWTNVAPSGGLSGVTLNGIGAADVSDAWAVGQSGSTGYIEACNGSCTTASSGWIKVTTTSITSGAPLNAADATGANSVWAVGNSGTIFACTASCNTATASWTSIGPGGANNLNALAITTGASSTYVVVVGGAGSAYFCNNIDTRCTTRSTAWTVESGTTGTTNTLLGIGTNGAAPTFLVAVGSNGDITTGTAPSTWLSPTVGGGNTPSGVLSPYTGTRAGGTSVATGAGAGWTSTHGATVTVYFNGTSVATPSTSGGSGTFSTLNFTTPAGTAGVTYPVLFSDPSGNATVAWFSTT